MKCNACSRFLLCNRKECKFRPIRDIEVKYVKNNKRTNAK